MTKPVAEKEANTISTLFSGTAQQAGVRPAADETIADELKGRTRIRSKFLVSSILPALLTVAAALGAILLTVQPVLRTQLLQSARNPAIAFASVAERVIGSEAITTPTVIGELDTALKNTKTSFQAQDINFVMITDATGSPLAGWYGDAADLSTVPETIRTAVQLQSRRATAQAYAAANDIKMGSYNPPSRAAEADGQRLEVAGEAIEAGGQPVGAVIVGINNQSVAGKIRSVLTNTFLAAALPVLLAVLLGVLLTRAITRNILYLIDASDTISRGDFSQSVQVRSNDELGDLSRAIERMRVSLQESLERLQRRRS